jgi:SAM-dependent methyltransferase
MSSSLPPPRHHPSVQPRRRRPAGFAVQLLVGCVVMSFLAWAALVYAGSAKTPRAIVPAYTSKPTMPPQTKAPRSVQIHNVFLKPREAGVAGSKLPMRADITHEKCAKYIREMHEQRIFHRKQWEFCYIMRELEEGGALTAGNRGVGFAVGREPMPSAIAARGVDVVISDLPTDDTISSAWGSSNQHAASIEQAHKPDLVDLATFKKHASFRAVDMNDVPYDLLNGTFDFAWSSSSLEHVGSCKRARRFLRKSVNAVKPGGLVVHTTEVVLSSLTRNHDIPGLCLFTKNMIQGIIDELRGLGHHVSPVRWGIGENARYDYDVQPYSKTDHMALYDPHAKVVHTSILLVIRRSVLQRRASVVPEPAVPWYMRYSLMDHTGDAAQVALAARERIHKSYLFDEKRAPVETLPMVSRLADRLELQSPLCQVMIAELGERPLPMLHRKQWEFCVMAHTLKELGVLQPGKSGLGFAVGREPLASYFVRNGAKVVVSDMPVQDNTASAWNSTAQHAGELKSTWRSGVVDEAAYMRNARFTPVDMNHLPAELLRGEFDFTWSSSSLEHVGTCQLGLDFFINQLDALKPGGVAVHTTELLVSHEDAVSDPPHLCFFSKGLMRELEADLRAEGHELVGGDIRFKLGVRNATDYDYAPFDLTREHLALVDLGHVHTSILIVVRRGPPRADSELTAEQRLKRQQRRSRGNHTAGAAAADRLVIPAQHIGLRPFVPQTMMAHAGDFQTLRMRRLLRSLGEPMAHRHRRQWEMATVVAALQSRGMLAPDRTGLGIMAVEEGMLTVMAGSGARLFIETADPVTIHRAGLGVEPSVVKRRVTLHLSPDPLEASIRRDPGEVDFVWSVTALSMFSTCQRMMQYLRDTLKLVRPGGVVVFALTVSIFGVGASGPDCCTLTYPAFKQLAEDLRAHGFNTSLPSPEVGWVTDADDYDTPPYSAADHMTHLVEGQLMASALLVVEAPPAK